MEEKLLVEMEDVTAGYPGHIAFRDVSIKVSSKEHVAIVGPNGGGKSTMLKVMMGLLPPKAGVVKVCGQNPYKNRCVKKRVSYLPQQSTINSHFPALIEDIVLLGLFGELGLVGRPTKEQNLRIEEALERVGLTNMIGEPFEHLSGGQKQRVLIARAFVGRPSLILLDEPTTGLDVASQEAIIEIIQDLTENEGITIIAVTHDQIFLQKWAKRIIRIDGRLVYDGPIEDYQGVTLNGYS